MNRTLQPFRSSAVRNLLLCLAVPIASSVAQSSPQQPAWVEGSTYQTGAVVSYQGFDYKALVIQTDWVGAGWDPADAPTLWSRLGPDGSAPTTTPPVSTPPTGSCAAGWLSTTAYNAGDRVSFNGVNYQANWWTRNNEPDTNNGAGGTGQPWTIAPGCTTGTQTPPVADPPANPPTTPPVQPPTPPPPPYFNPNDTSTGTISFHLLLGAGTAQDSLNLAGGNYTDLIESNIIAGVMMGHLIDEQYPGMQFNKDYLYGSIMGQLLQENIETELYNANSNLLDPSADQQAVMGMGQGGPYQINNYAADMVSGTYAPAGHSLINYIALQNSIGYTFANAEGQHILNTPASFNDKYFGPLLTAYFHFNDMVALSVTGKGPGGWTTPWEPAYDQALDRFITLPGNFLDVVLNAAYNQGYYGPLVGYYSTLGATATASTVASVDDFAGIWGTSDTYKQYPYQVRYYLNQLYDNPNPTTDPHTMVTPQNVVDFFIASLETVFTNVYTKLSYTGPNGHLAVISATQAQAAFESALTQAGIAPTASLKLSDASDRALIFTLLENAIATLEQNLGTQFNATSATQVL